MVSATNNQENDGVVKVLRQKDGTKNKNDKKITKTEIETKTSELFCDFSNSPVGRTSESPCWEGSQK